MMNCENMKNNMPLYLDNLLSAADKYALDEHLKSCPECTRAFAKLQKTGNLVDGLAEVEPPPWFKQRIMARVRQEAKKKSLAQKWFYPLRIKVPVQVFATIFIVVIAVYIYRASNEQMKSVMPPPAPVIEAKKDQMPEQSPKSPEVVTSTVTKAKVAARKDMQDEERVMSDVSSSVTETKTQEMKKAISRENIRTGAADVAKTGKADAAADKKEANFAALSEKKAESVKAMPQSIVAMDRKKEGYVLGAGVKESGTPEAQSIMPKIAILLRVKNINAAVGEVEKLFIKYEAKKVIKQILKGKAIFTAELRAENIKYLMAQFKIIGQVEEKRAPADSVEGDISLAIEILSD